MGSLFDTLKTLLAGSIAIAAGLVDAHTGSVLGNGVDTSLVVGGFGLFGVHVGGVVANLSPAPQAGNVTPVAPPPTPPAGPVP